jgi:hypothetical protein
MTVEKEGSYFTSYGYGGFDKKSANLPPSEFAGVQTAWKVTWRPRHIISKDDVAASPCVILAHAV